MENTAEVEIGLKIWMGWCAQPKFKATL